MKHICKILSAILALTLVLTSNIVPAMACTVEYDGHDPEVIPCEQVAEKGYCDIPLLHYGSIAGEMRPWVNPYYRDTAEVTEPEVTETPVTMSIETEPIATEAPVETTPIEEQRFADVAPDAWYYEAVNTMAENGILNGYSDGLFHPDDYLTEGELCTIIWRLATTDEPWASDKVMGKYHWAAKVMNSLHWSHAVAVYTTANPSEADDYVLRPEATTAIMALLQEAGRMTVSDDDGDGVYTWASNYYTQVHNWTEADNPIPDWDVITEHAHDTPFAKQWFPNRILAMYNFGFIHGKDDAGTFGVYDNLTRAEFCQMLYNAGITECLHVDMEIWGRYQYVG